MDIFSILSLIGGLALFLYGMNAMGDGLAKVSGGKMERILEKLTSNPVKSVLLGAGVTAVIQSSSATTVMVVGFVNSGIMKLHQAVGIIMGANIGTTATSWILSLTGIESDNFFIQLMKPSSFSPVLAFIGVALILFSKREKKKDVGMIMIGFAILMFGMDSMSAAVEPLADNESFTSILTMFSNPVLGILAGMILTAVIQSSSASVGILQALCVTGSLHYSTALPIIMGQNIGTCITAMLSSIGASKNAKRTALIHLYFNIIGTFVFVVGFYSINAFVPFEFLKNSATPAGIAVIHSIFNIVATVILLPFGTLLEKLAIMTVRDHEEDVIVSEDSDSVHVLDYRFLEKPGFAVEQCKKAATTMAELAKKALFLSFELVEKYDEEKAEEVVALENSIDKYEDALGTYLIKLSNKPLNEKDNLTLTKLLHCIGDIERMSDHAVNIMESTKEMYDKDLKFSNKAVSELKIFTRAMKDIITRSVNVFISEDTNEAKKIEPLEEVIDALNSELKKRHVKRLRKGKCTIELGFVLSDITTNYERISDHCSNIAICIIQLQNNEMEAHGYLEAIKTPDNKDFQDMFQEYSEIYTLP